MNKHKSLTMALAILTSLFIAVSLTIVPLPDWLLPYRPAWVPMTLIYWAMVIPQTMGLGVVWTIGLFMDAAQGTLLGQHAIGYTVTTYVTLRLHQRLRAHPLSQQALMVGLMLLPFMSITLWIKGIQGQAPHTWLYWAPVFTSIVFWPVTVSLLCKFNRFDNYTF